MLRVKQWNIGLSLSLAVLSTLGLSVNYLYYQYPGNNYFPLSSLFVGYTLTLMYFGFRLLFGPKHPCARMLEAVIQFFCVMAVVALATNAAQYTPFTPIDQYIVACEAFFHVHLSNILQWTATKPALQGILVCIYDSLPYQVAYLPLLLIALQRYATAQEYFFLLLISALLGFTFYYFFPTLAPASTIESPYFSAAQRATGLKFLQIHQHIPPSTIEGGMIALPSFHVIWAWFCVHLFREWRFVWWILLIINGLLVLSCVLLGWHYLLDVMGGLVIILLSHGLYCFALRNPNKRANSYRYDWTKPSAHRHVD